MDFIGEIKDGQWTLSRQQSLLRKQWFNTCKTGNLVKETLTKVGRDKSRQQVKCHFGLVVATIRDTFRERGWDLSCIIPNLNIPSGYEVPVEVIQKILYACCGDVGENGERRTLSKMTTTEASAFFEKCRVYAANKWQIQIPDPDPLRRTK